MSRKIDQFKALMMQAVHPNTGLELARTSALIAIKLAHKYKFEISEQDSKDKVQNTQSSSPEPYGDDMHGDIPNPHDTSGWVETPLFTVRLTKTGGTCKSCGKSYNRDEIIAAVYNVGITHYKCRHYWTTKTRK